MKFVTQCFGSRIVHELEINEECHDLAKWLSHYLIFLFFSFLLVLIIVFLFILFYFIFSSIDT